jgi:hypothetical protein
MGWHLASSHNLDDPPPLCVLPQIIQDRDHGHGGGALAERDRGEVGRGERKL